VLRVYQAIIRVPRGAVNRCDVTGSTRVKFSFRPLRLRQLPVLTLQLCEADPFAEVDVQQGWASCGGSDEGRGVVYFCADLQRIC
jgi:hypothetical protein